MAGELHPVVGPLSPAQIAMRAAYAVALSVANIDAPATELALIAGANAGEIRRVHQVVAGADEWTEYAWDNASSAGTASPYRLPGSSGQWRAVSGKYQDGDRYINGTLTLTGGLTVAGTTAFSGAFSVVDGNFSILGSGDATKIAKLEVDGFTTGTTRTFTLPDASITVAGINLAQTFSAAQTFDLGSGSDPATALAGTVLTVRNANATNNRILGVAYGANGVILSGRAVGGTRASPTATTSGQVLLQLTGFGYDGSAYATSSSALYEQAAGSLWTGSNKETYHGWRCTPSGSTTNTERMRLLSSGALFIGTTFTDDGTNKLQVEGGARITDASTIGPSSGGAASANILTLQNNTGGTCLRFATNTGTIYNWIAASEFTNANEFEITPSTATGGSTFSTPALRIAGAAGGTLTIARPTTITGAATLSSTLAVVGAVTVAAAGATSNPFVVIGPTGAGSTETNQALRVGNISSTGKYLAMGYDSTNDYAYISGIHAATGWKTVAINPYANAICSINAGGGATTVGGTLGVTGAATLSSTLDVVGQITSTKLGTVLSATTATTGQKSIHLQNTGCDAYFGCESSVGGATFTGSAAYDAVFYTPQRLYLAGFADVLIGGSGSVIIQSGMPLKLGNAAVAGTPTPTHTITVKDSTGTTYRVPCVV